MARILIAPLGWGLGHATRCMPIAAELQQRGHEVLWASDGLARKLLQAEFPEQPVLQAPALNITYQGQNMVWNIARQLPRIRSVVSNEHHWLRSILRPYRIDGVISDNRYGFYTDRVPTVFMGHQLNIRVPFTPMQWAVRRLHTQYLGRFSDVWVPDYPDIEDNLSGDLAHGGEAKRIKNVRYVGALSRFEPLSTANKGDYMLILLSGPEPQRTILEELLVKQAAILPHRFVLVRGLPGRSDLPPMPPNIEVHASLPAASLRQAIAAAQLVICRSGYSTLMDLDVLGSKALLIPTPGQTEQEYLANRLAQSDTAHIGSQSAVMLEKDIPKAIQKKGFGGRGAKRTLLSEAVKAFEAML